VLALRIISTRQRGITRYPAWPPARTSPQSSPVLPSSSDERRSGCSERRTWRTSPWI
jgi:hypothetical protein